MSLQKQLRIPFLAITFCGLLITLGKTILDPNIGKPTPFSFPAEVPLPKWQQQTSRPLTAKMAEYPEDVLIGRHYSYIENSNTLDIEVYYMLNTNRDVQKLISDYTSIKIPRDNSLVVRYADKVGFYGLFSYNGQAYLSSCINRRGGSTVTQKQFIDNRNKYDLQLGRILPWLLGPEKLRDSRCLWTLLSTPSTKAAPEPAYQVLENAWISWHDWWQPRFPKY